MGLETVTALARRRVRSTKGDSKFCPDCTAYVGSPGVADGIHRMTQTACPGSPEAHVAASHPPHVVEHDHEHG